MKAKIKWNVNTGFVMCIPDWELSIDIDEFARDLADGAGSPEVQDNVWEAAHADFEDTITMSVTNLEEIMDLIRSRAMELKRK